MMAGMKPDERQEGGKKEEWKLKRPYRDSCRYVRIYSDIWIIMEATNNLRKRHAAAFGVARNRETDIQTSKGEQEIYFFDYPISYTAFVVI